MAARLQQAAAERRRAQEPIYRACFCFCLLGMNKNSLFLPRRGTHMRMRGRGEWLTTRRRQRASGSAALHR